MVKKQYTALLQACQNTEISLGRRDRIWSILRLLAFIIFVGIVIWAFQLHLGWGFLTIYIFGFAFVKLVKYQNGMRKERLLNVNILELNKAEIACLDNNPTAFHNGQEYQNALHPYSSDLDIYGNRSLYQYICRCNTFFGREALASRLSAAQSHEQIMGYQSAIQEVEQDTSWCQRLYALGKLREGTSQDESKIYSWLQSQTYFKPNPWIIIALIVFNIAAAWYLMVYISWQIVYLAFIPAGLYLVKYKKKIDELQMSMGKQQEFLESYSDILEHVWNKKFASPLNTSIRDLLSKDDIKSYKAIRQLSYYKRQLDIRDNFFGILFSVFFLWDHFYAYRIYNWKKKFQPYLGHWLEVIGEMEYISSMATFAHNHPEWVYPRIVPNGSNIVAQSLGHPLLHDSQRVSNDFEMSTAAFICLVTGSNMGGKSTFLRTVGINLVLAYTGSKCCTTSMNVPILEIYSSMRSQDALEENTSSFYAELKKIKEVLDAVKSGRKVFYLMDEILKGTNSNDRHEGSKKLISQLLQYPSGGLISTHDLELGDMASQYPRHIHNICFEVEADGDQLVFDYKLRKGVSKSFNATQLMRNMGIDV